MPTLMGFIVRRARSVAPPRHADARRLSTRFALIPAALLAVAVVACDEAGPPDLTPHATAVATEASARPRNAAVAPRPNESTETPRDATHSEEAVSRAPLLSDHMADDLSLAVPTVEGPHVLAAASAPTQEPPPVMPTTAPLVTPTATVVAPVPVEPSPPLNARAIGLFRAMNEARAANGLAPFSLASDLIAIAHARSADMSAGGYFAHVSPSGESWLSLLTATGARVLGGGENLARVSGDEANAVGLAIAHLMDSATHRANILHASFDEVGVAAVTDVDGVTVFTTIFAAR